MLEQIRESLSSSLDDLVNVCLPYAQKHQLGRVDSLSKLIADTRQAIEFLQRITEQQVNEFFSNNFIEGEKILDGVLRMKESWS
jgi:hypothetical protein